MASQEGVREFESGATRNDTGPKFDYEGFLNPEALATYAAYMHEHRTQRDGSLRNPDNWQLGIPFHVYVKSLVRHTVDLWRVNRGYTVLNPDTGKPHTKKDLCCAIIFNAFGYLKELVDPSEINVPSFQKNPLRWGAGTGPIGSGGLGSAGSGKVGTLMCRDQPVKAGTNPSYCPVCLGSHKP